MNNKVAREGFVQGVSQAGVSRDKVYDGIAGEIFKTAGDDKSEKKQEKEQEKAEKKEQKFSDKMKKKEAEALGFFVVARACGWGIYSVDSLDGGEGGIWYLEKDAITGEEFLCKQVDSAGDVIRRVKTASQKSVSMSA